MKIGLLIKNNLIIKNTSKTISIIRKFINKLFCCVGPYLFVCKYHYLIAIQNTNFFVKYSKTDGSYRN